METINTLQQSVLSWMTLLASTTTLLCCALPILLVALGFGAVVASITSTLPVLVILTEYKPWMFTASALLMGLTGWLLWVRPLQCPSDPALAQRCARARVWNRRVFWVACLVWLLGFSAAYLALPVRNLAGF